ncbi:MAG: molybdopterin-dependent oxidoreductase [Verrucomicrobia bacterium]|nr:molybdopterin-dependent oxidoreductase [Verrucomicrobiota bacterium]
MNPAKNLPLPRRDFLLLTGGAAAAALLPSVSAPGRDPVAAPPPGGSANAAPAEMVRLPEKTDLLLVTDRPPQLETPLGMFTQDLTPNELFYVRWHLSEIPLSVDLAAFRLKVGGHVETPLELSVEQLKKDFPAAEVVAVNQCSGNSRSFFNPPVAGVQWGNGAVGNARWKGVRLRDLLAKAGVKAGAVEVAFNGLDKPLLDKTPDFAKALPTDVALQPNVLVAYEMNGAPLPILNGFPVRLVVPGWYATYWVKMLNDIRVTTEKSQSFWMEKAYRIPASARANETPDKLDPNTVPISKMNVRSFVVAPAEGGDVSLKQGIEIHGVAFDGGSGIKKVEISTDGGKTWADARLGPDLGNYSWRRFRLDWKPKAAGAVRVMARATSNAGETQDDTVIWNRSGYMRNNIEHVDVFVS